jgi:hypothetical protein
MWDRRAGGRIVAMTAMTAADRPMTAGVELTFETLDARSPLTAPVRVLADRQILLRVVTGTVGLASGGEIRFLEAEEEARIDADVPHRL